MARRKSWSDDMLLSLLLFVLGQGQSKSSPRRLPSSPRRAPRAPIDPYNMSPEDQAERLPIDQRRGR